MVMSQCARQALSITLEQRGEPSACGSAVTTLLDKTSPEDGKGHGKDPLPALLQLPGVAAASG